MRRRAWILGGILVLLATMGSVAWATTSASGKLVGCAKKSGGALRLVGTVKDCRKTERAVSWSPVGQPGPRGPAGARGPAGEDGAAGIDGEDGFDGDDGADGLDGYDGANGAPGPATKLLYVYSAPVAIPAGPSTTVSSEICVAPLAQAVNGGIKVNGLAAGVRVRATAPKGSGPQANQWEAEVENTGAASAPVTAWVLCTNGTPGP